MNLSEWADVQGIHCQAAYQWFREGTVPVPARKEGRMILVGDLEIAVPQRGTTVFYASITSSVQRDDHDRQVSLVSTWATSHGYSIDRVVSEVGSGLNGTRQNFSPGSPTPRSTIVVEHRELRQIWFRVRRRFTRSERSSTVGCGHRGN